MPARFPARPARETNRNAYASGSRAISLRKIARQRSPQLTQPVSPQPNLTAWPIAGDTPAVPRFGREADTPIQTSTDRKPRPAFRTAAGRLFVGDAADALASPASAPVRRQTVQLVFTSPPFPLCREKKYGNLRGDAYAEWLAGVRQTARRIPDADRLDRDRTRQRLGIRASRPFRRRRSKRLLAFQEAAGLAPVPGVHLLQPGPAADAGRVGDGPPGARQGLVHPRLVAVADAAPEGRQPPGADRLQRQHEAAAASEAPTTAAVGRRSIRSAIDRSWPTTAGRSRRTCWSRRRPDRRTRCWSSPTPAATAAINGPAGRWRSRATRRGCRKGSSSSSSNFLTDPGDLVLDPFAGSNTTGAVAEALGRKWLAIERDPEYARASRARFMAEDGPAGGVTRPAGRSVTWRPSRPWVDRCSGKR